VAAAAAACKSEGVGVAVHLPVADVARVGDPLAALGRDELLRQRGAERLAQHRVGGECVDGLAQALRQHRDAAFAQRRERLLEQVVGAGRAGLDGIARRLDPGPACSDDLFEQPLAALRERGIGVLPQSLGEAVEALQADTVLCEALGSTLAAEFIEAKRAEWIAYARHVSDWEMQRYGDLF